MKATKDDALNRLTQAINPIPSNPLETYTYDPVGNWERGRRNGVRRNGVGEETGSHLYL